MDSESLIHFNGLDSAVHGPIRLGILCILKSQGETDFTTFKKRLNVGDGPLGIHLLKLEELNYISCRKEFVNRRPRSSYTLTTTGGQALQKYLDTMQRLLDSLGHSPVNVSENVSADSIVK